jgi:hypothetical protein
MWWLAPTCHPTRPRTARRSCGAPPGRRSEPSCPGRQSGRLAPPHSARPSGQCAGGVLLAAHSETVGAGAKMPVRQQRQVSTRPVTTGGYDCFTPTPVAHVRWPLWSKIGSGGGGAESALSRLQLARSRLAPGALGSLDPPADPCPGAKRRDARLGDQQDAHRGASQVLLASARVRSRRSTTMLGVVAQHQERAPGPNAMRDHFADKATRGCHRIAARGAQILRNACFGFRGLPRCVGACVSCAHCTDVVGSLICRLVGVLRNGEHAA